MSGLILELQADCLDPSSSVSSLLRKALVVSRKLSIASMEDWINAELGGYKGDIQVPTYRVLKGSVKALNPYRGWIPIQFADGEMSNLFSSQNVNQPLSELEQLVRNGSGTLTITYNDEAQRMLMDGMDLDFEPRLHISSASVGAIFDAVRNKILDWTLHLESRGITGEGLSFSIAEKAAAASSFSIVNNIGQMTNSQLQQHSPQGSQAMHVSTQAAELGRFVQELEACLPSLKLPAQAAGELQADLTTLQSQAASPKPKPGIVRESLKSVRTILEGAAGSVLATEFATKAIALLALWPAY